MIRVCLAGATGWAGSELARAIARESDLTLVAAVSRSHAGDQLSDVLDDRSLSAPIYGTAEDALRHPCDVFVEYTSPEVAKANILAALAAGAHVVVGTSGLSDGEYAEIDAMAQRQRRAVLACAAMAAKLIPQWEIIDYADAAKLDAPSGTVRELATRLARLGVPPTGSDSRIHSVRLPGYVISAEIVFGMPDQRLSIRHDAGNSARPYVDGALLAIRKVGSLTGLHRGLDTVLDL
jgi:4-hydroxy-tetrahydrodipicolinate reductase